MDLVHILQNAFDIGYEQKLNELYTAKFSLPADDPKSLDCLPFNFVEIYENGERVDLFRILPTKQAKDAEGLIKTYQCEHVLGTLLDDLLFQYHQTTNLSPSNTIQYILNHQNTVRWQLGYVDFTDIFSYKWENENLLSALFSIPQPYSGDYQWTWDTSIYPWRLNLISPSSEVSAYIRYRKNLIGIEKEVDPTKIRTRLYCLGYGEGDNQLTIKSVNSNKPYVEADTFSLYGIISDFYIDKTEENPVTLKAKAQAALEKIKVPQITYKVKAADIYQITEDSIDKFTIGNVVQVYDDESNIEFAARIVSLSRDNITESPWDVELEISNKALTISDSITSLQNLQRINNCYAQGATNIDSNDYQDNCDATHPAVIKFYIPNECVRINKCMLSYEVEKFRTYEKSIESNLGSSQTSSAGGGLTATSGGNDWFTEEGYTSGMAVTNWELTGDNEHRHYIDGVNHSHDVDIPEHAHDVNIPPHNHDINYGIYEYSNLPESVIIKVDGNTVAGVTGINENDINIVSYLSKDSEGKITRGTFHKVEIFPNTSEQNPVGLARITATVVKQIFLQSRGEGNY